ncbi:MAG: ACT domain-containing protein [Wenzhouxiangella sp.]|jgi:[protein-PII] uridylyltransferase|nr:ACT domain-containing protein [Wenzhouxiangella sp.]
MTSAEIRISPLRHLTCVEMAATDRPGLLSAIAEALVTCGVQLLDARVATFGQRVEDVFLVSDDQGRALTETACQALEDALRRQLDTEIPSQQSREPA